MRGMMQPHAQLLNILNNRFSDLKKELDIKFSKSLVKKFKI